MMELTYSVKPTLPAIFGQSKALTVVENRERFNKLEEFIFSFPQLVEEDYDLTEYNSGGMYGRQITIPRGACITGRIYKVDHLEIMLKGDIVILSADGGAKRYTGYNVIEAKAGKRQAGFAYEDTTWLTVNIVPGDVEDKLGYTAVLTYEEFNEHITLVNTNDYANFLAELGLTEDQMQDIVTVDDVVDLPADYSHIYVGESHLAGKGLFSTTDLIVGDIVCPTRLGECRTIAGRYSNHALVPNTEPALVDGQFVAVVSRNIPAGEEITMNYRDIIKFRQDKEDL